MNSFDTFYNNLINEEQSKKNTNQKISPLFKGSTIPKNTLAPSVFQYSDNCYPILQPFIKTQIIKDLETINRVAPVYDFYIVGKILTKQINSSTPIEINVEFNKQDLEPVSGGLLNRLLAQINGRFAAGTTHPIYYYITKPDSSDLYPSVYDVVNERWRKLNESFENFFSESIIDYARKNLDPNLWEINSKKPHPTLKPIIKTAIIDLLKKTFKNRFEELTDEIHITGSIGTQQWTKNTDIDIHIIPKNIEKNKDKYIRLQKQIKDYFNNKKYIISSHPVDVYLQLDPEQEVMGDSSYNVITDEWIKLPFILSPNFDPDVHFAYLETDLKNMFLKIDSALGELRREVIDFNIIDDYINQLDDNEKLWLQNKLHKKIDQIENTINYLILQKDQYHQLRKVAYTDADAEQAWEDAVKSKSWKPQNIMWKMLDRYKYIKVILSLQKILNRSDDKLTAKDINKIDKIIKFKEHFINEAQNIKIYNKKWQDPLSRHAMNIARGMGRKYFQQVPQYDRPDRFDKVYPHAESILKRVKKSHSGIWKIPFRTVIEISRKYKLKTPNQKDPFKKLGRSNIFLWYKKRAHSQDIGGYYLIKNKMITDQFKRKRYKHHYPRMKI